ncbi:MAG: coiled-coil domain-containing protein [Solirubrobacterales bacterium]
MKSPHARSSATLPALFAATIIVAVCTLFLILPHGARAETPASINLKIEALSEQVHNLQGRINQLQGNQDAAQEQLNRQTARQQALAGQLTASRARLARLKRELAHSKRVLSHRIVAVYKGGEPDVLSIVLQSGGFAQMVERATYLSKIAKQDQTTIDHVATLKLSTHREAVRLTALEGEARQLVAQTTTKRNGIATAKNKVIAQAGPLRSQLAKQRRILQATAAAVGVQPGSPTQQQFKVVGNDGASSGRVSLNSDGSASAPSNAPSAIKAAVAAGNQIARTPYIWGGGHGSFSDRGYDCSGSVSYVLHAAGVLSSPMASGGLMGWGASGPGKWITVYANAGHAWMTVGGLRFDTSGRSGTGSRWQTGMDAGGGFTVRHYPGL